MLQAGDMHERDREAVHRAVTRHRLGLGLGLGLALAAALWAGAAAAASHPVAVEVVKPGREGLELTARLSADGGVIAQGMSWLIRTPGGALVHESEAGSLDISLSPGDYVVEAVYGAASETRSVSIPPGARLLVSFILEAGGLRIDAKLAEGDFPAALPQIRVFALAGDRLVAAGPAGGGIIRLPAGRYRVESRAASGNAAAVTDVEVKPGRISTLAITHKAGLARLAFVGSAEAAVSWQVEDARGRTVARENGLSADVLLTPGTYTARAAVGDELLTATFRIAAGEARDILLGN
jgi:hypothetical protein